MTDQNINIIYSVVCLNHKARNIYKKKISNFVTIYLKADINKIILLKKKRKVYNKKKKILGIDILPEYPTKPDFIIENDLLKNNLKRS